MLSTLIKKIFRLSPTLNIVNNKDIDTRKNKKLNITFLEGQKYSHKFVPSPKAKEGIDQIEELLNFIDHLPPYLKKSESKNQNTSVEYKK